MRLLVTRPAENAEPLIRRLAGAGHEVVASPLMEIHPLGGAPLDLAGVQAILVTSRNGVRALAAATRRRDLPVLAVGAASAAAAREAGFGNVASAEGDVAALARLARVTRKPEGGTLLHVAGSATAGDLAGLLAGYRLSRAVLYEAKPALHLPEGARTFLEKGAPGGVLLYSPRSATLFAALTKEAGLAAAAGPLTAYCLSAAVAAAARRLPFGRIVAAAAPNEAALLGLIALEQDPRPS